MKAQITLTVNESKRIIARGLKEEPKIKNAFSYGKILLKGGTTVSAISEELINMPLGISGRISTNGTKGSKSELDAPHCILIDKGQVIDVDEEEKFEESALSMSKGDVLITGANIFDVHGNAAMMAGSPLGNFPGKIIPALNSEGIDIIIAAGLEKLSPVPVNQSIKAAGRKDIEISFGMAVGLIPIYGELVHEQKAIEMLADVKATVIGRGGIMGGEGSTTLILEGKSEEVYRIVEVVKTLKGSDISGSPKSLVECTRGSIGCVEDLGCIYKKGY
ncbi:conserved hypothetical protein [[Clostridium] ultunense Esp]|uniref:Uncharacterized protein n=1 Tax=Anaerosalibacter bizertensis TaxID=932217 RepID=A0A9Q4ADA6_9FIRM|nr:hypothetical protein [Anaerosalibacter bizertensis]MBV1820488.1 hypothetical protein [Bacteroidales bacterium MSK.15.36]MCB5560226.1 hypothetical protein [Anaerosalibacter bizertensis]MCG4565602.1 hypothetical protein [Anaerosalibacter bizertensis]CCQ96984.1 conserved hypothetical protein [[Clostridium] ultunense Esp]